jgi:hypothetical protein
MYNDTESLHTLQVSDVNVAPTSVERGNRKIFDTRDLSQINLVYNNVTFQLFPGFNIAHKGNSETHT